MGVVELDSDYYGFLIEQGVCSNDIWSADHEFGYAIGDAGYPAAAAVITGLHCELWGLSAAACE
jgi:hypothetical protein